MIKRWFSFAPIQSSRESIIYEYARPTRSKKNHEQWLDGLLSAMKPTNKEARLPHIL